MVLTTVTFTTQNYAIAIREDLAESELQEITDEIASKVIEVYNIGKNMDSGNVSITLSLERIVSNSFYYVSLNDSQSCVIAYLQIDSDVRAVTYLHGIGERVELTGSVHSSNNSYIFYDANASPDQIILSSSELYRAL